MIERVLWRLVLALIVIGAVLSVWAAMGGDLSPTQVKMIAWSYGVAIYASMGLGCAAVLHRVPTSLGARAGLVTSAAGAVLYTLGIWSELLRYDWWWKAFAITFVLSLATVHASLLLLVSLSTRFAPFRAITRACSYGCALVITFMVVFERTDDILFRVVSVTATIAFFGTLAMPVLWKLSNPKTDAG
jgi:hypothetical protein